MIERARSALPNEACGILVGIKEEMLKFYPAANREASRSHYFLGPSEQLEIFREVEERGWELLGDLSFPPRYAGLPLAAGY